MLTIEKDLSLPKSMIARLAKGVLPANTQIHKDALLALHKSATVFVNYIASTAYENAQLSNKKTIMPPDVVTALKDAEFEGFLPRLDAELKKYNDIQCDKRNTYRRKVKEDKVVVLTTGGEGEDAAGNATTAPANGEMNGATNGHAPNDDERPAKKQKGDTGDTVSPDQDAMNDDELEDGQNADQDEEVEDASEDEDVDEDDDVIDEAADHQNAADVDFEALMDAQPREPETPEEDIEYSDESD
ncbi:hypothetical protein LTR35_011837 [Friedmanniomyces endolithicus]|uniref:DNA polymerase epsilon subunit D n=1 Tax=Friedmanniomyces endolithicus TaxID=329885 RepID=A0AAN6FDM2_9PEZI|nr:hypothetical protein LTR35_011837 [Friedmanniomyces endolithicus]KAK0293232.1 hypothetical protein LTS00_007478 [Friedmanniomyces endolithicus]KAK0313230.1 hypothetical protein LTR82_013661 [Friedmanniomyces endolithicus]KAK0823475.1 hypothetical protein LTR73_008473 [Friedmanniomyces endolithicus]KAK0991481.1 hypothetical protein LTR54_011848 [Friedmanniomyces endolithicus]